jgi:hypothetical protein
MKEFTVYFELFGKKMKITIFAENESTAKELIRGKIIFHKIERKDFFNRDKSGFDFIMDLLTKK